MEGSQSTGWSSLKDAILGMFGVRVDDPISRSLTIINVWLSIALIVGAGGLVICSLPFKLDFGSRLFGLGLLVAGGATISGFVLGFLFGVPRAAGAPSSRPSLAARAAPGNVSIQLPGETEVPKDQPAKEAAATPAEESITPTGVAPAAQGPARTQLSVNTNLEQISDWLTKIMVGVGLTQYHALGRAIDDFVSFLNAGFRWESGRVYGFAILFYFGPLGFISGYLYTRTFFTRLFTLVEDSE